MSHPFLDSFHPYPLTRPTTNVGHRCQTGTDVLFTFIPSIYLNTPYLLTWLPLLSCRRISLCELTHSTQYVSLDTPFILTRYLLHVPR